MGLDASLTVPHLGVREGGLSAASSHFPPSRQPGSPSKRPRHGKSPCQLQNPSEAQVTSPRPAGVDNTAHVPALTWCLPNNKPIRASAGVAPLPFHKASASVPCLAWLSQAAPPVEWHFLPACAGYTPLPWHIPHVYCEPLSFLFLLCFLGV